MLATVDQCTNGTVAITYWVAILESEITLVRKTNEAPSNPREINMTHIQVGGLLAAQGVQDLLDQRALVGEGVYETLPGSSSIRVGCTKVRCYSVYGKPGYNARTCQEAAESSNPAISDGHIRLCLRRQLHRDSGVEPLRDKTAPPFPLRHILGVLPRHDEQQKRPLLTARRHKTNKIPRLEPRRLIPPPPFLRLRRVTQLGRVCKRQERLQPALADEHMLDPRAGVGMGADVAADELLGQRPSGKGWLCQERADDFLQGPKDVVPQEAEGCVEVPLDRVGEEVRAGEVRGGEVLGVVAGDLVEDWEDLDLGRVGEVVFVLAAGDGDFDGEG